MRVTHTHSFFFLFFLLELQQITHLQHAPFEYTITVVNDNDTPKQGFFRIFLVPKVDDRGEPLIFNDQRCLAIEMDKFTLPCK